MVMHKKGIRINKVYSQLYKVKSLKREYNGQGKHTHELFEDND